MEFFNPEAYCPLDYNSDDVRTVKNLFNNKKQIN